MAKAWPDLRLRCRTVLRPAMTPSRQQLIDVPQTEGISDVAPVRAADDLGPNQHITLAKIPLPPH